MKIAIVGIGVIAKVHINALQALKENIAGLCDIDKPKAEEVARQFGLACPIFENYSEMLQTLRPDAVHICTPHYLHADMIIEALGRNIHVLCEKPLCIREEDIGRILATEASSKATLGVCFQNRYNPTNQYVKKLLETTKLKGAHGSVVWKRTVDYYRSADWRGKKATEGGGVMINQAIHTLDLLQWFSGEPKQVTAHISTMTLGDVIEVEDTANALFDGDVPFSIFATVSSGCDHPVCIQLRTEDKKSITLRPHSVLVNDTLVFSEEQQPVRGKDCYGNSHGRLFSDFYECIRQNRPFPINGTEGAKAVRLILAMYQSQGKPTPIKL